MTPSQNSPARTPEAELLLHCLRAPVDPRSAARVAAMAGAEIDWPQFLILVEKHCALLPAANQLLAAGREQIPPTWRKVLERGLDRRSLGAIRLAAAMLEALAALEAEGVTAVPYKGPALAHLLYGNVSHRECGDVDFLVRQRDVPRLVPVMVRLGYKSHFPAGLASANPRPAPSEYSFYHSEKQALLEFHTERTLRHFPSPPDFGREWRSLDSIELGGRRVPMLGRESLLLYLCVHGGKDFWQRLQWINDIAALLQRGAELDWDSVFARARAAEAEGILLLGLALARDPLGATLPEEVSRRLAAAPGTERLAGQIRRSLFDPEPVLPGALERLRFRSAMHGGGWRSLSYSLRLALAPTEEDTRFVSLPPTLTPLYGLLRPFRLLYRHSIKPRGPSYSSYEGTPFEVIDPLLDFSSVTAEDVVYELGCGDGRCVIAAAQRGARGVGVDVNPKLIEQARSQARAAGVQRRTRFVVGDALKMDLSDATVVLLYLPTAFNLRLRPKLQRELRSGARIISRDLDMGDWLPEDTRPVTDNRGVTTEMYRWRI
jgi:hypothetical protein